MGMNSSLTSDILRLSVAERILLVEDGAEVPETIELSEAEQDLRLAHYHQHPDSGSCDNSFCLPH